MRIRNSRTSMPILPLPPEIDPTASRFRTRGPLINGGFLVQEGSQSKSESGSTSRSSNCSQIQRDGIWSRCSPHIVLALSKFPRPESNLKTPSIPESERELPLKKRMHYRSKVDKKDEAKQEKAAEKKPVKKQEVAAVTEVNMDATMMSEKEDSSETNGGQRGKSVCCVLNCESFIPSPVMDDGVKEQEKAKELLHREGEGVEVEKRRRGRPKKKPNRFSRGNQGVKKSIFVLD